MLCTHKTDIYIIDQYDMFALISCALLFIRQFIVHSWKLMTKLSNLGKSRGEGGGKKKEKNLMFFFLFVVVLKPFIVACLLLFFFSSLLFRVTFKFLLKFTAQAIYANERYHDK